MRALLVALALLVVAVGAFAGLVSTHGPASRTREPASVAAAAGPTRAEIDAAIARGVKHLVSSQNPRGSWGSTASNLWDIYAPVPGSFITFEVGVTALDVLALVEVGGDLPGAKEAARRGTEWLLAHHGEAKRVSPDVLYNVWASAYALECFAALLEREQDPARRDALLAACAVDVDLLTRFEFVDGGWGYYNFDIAVQRPEHGSTSFTTATVLVAMKRAKDQGVRIPDRLVRRALALIETCRKPDWAFAYSWEHRYFPQGRINKTQGSLARTPACVDAMARWGAPVPNERIVEALDHLDRFGAYLRIAKQYPRPHESWFQNSGYFCYYGYYYAADLLELVPPAPRRRHAASIAAALLPLQEPSDGSWWDYQLYGYHKAYGTGYVLTALGRCRDERP